MQPEDLSGESTQVLVFLPSHRVIQAVPSKRDAVFEPEFIGSGLKEDILAGGETAMKELVKHKMRVYGSAGAAAGS